MRGTGRTAGVGFSGAAVGGAHTAASGLEVVSFCTLATVCALSGVTPASRAGFRPASAAQGGTRASAVLAGGHMRRGPLGTLAHGAQATAGSGGRGQKSLATQFSRAFQLHTCSCEGLLISNNGAEVL